MEKSCCRKCGSPVLASTGGRHAVYCSTACRRLVEFEIRRLTRALDELENRRLQLQEPGVLASTIRDVDGRTSPQQLADIEHSIATVEQRLRVFFDETKEEI